MDKNYFEILNSIDVGAKTEKKGNLTYLSWAWAWAEVKKRHPSATYTVYENRDEWNYFTDGKTCWVKVGVTVNGIEHVEMLPVMDFKNKSISAEAVTSFDVNKSIQRALTKAVARHGLGLYIYAGEDLPEDTTEYKCCDCGKLFTPYKNYSAAQVYQMSQNSNTDGQARCTPCMTKAGTRVPKEERKPVEN